MGKGNKKETTVAAVGEYRSVESPRQYTPDTAPINFQVLPGDVGSEHIVSQDLQTIPLDQNDFPQTVEENQNYNKTESIALRQYKPHKALNIHSSFLESVSQVYISGAHNRKGNVFLKNKDIIEYVINNNGLYHIVAPQSLKKTIVDIIENGSHELLGKKYSVFERERAINIFKKDNVML
jgi:hypothetical protein